MEHQGSINTRPFLLQSSSYQVWVQAIARFLYQAGHGSIHFFIPLIFVNQLGFSATIVGLGISIGSLAGVGGHVLGGYLTDSPKFGRKVTLLLSAGALHSPGDRTRVAAKFTSTDCGKFNHGTQCRMLLDCC